MSTFVEQGTITASAIVTSDPDRSGNFVATGATDQVEINAAIIYTAAIGGGEVVIGPGEYALTATVNIPESVLLRGMGWSTMLLYDAGGNCITFTGDNAKLRDLKIVIVAGAGAGGSRPNGILADTRTNIEVSGVWVVGDLTVADDGSDLRQCGVVFSTVTESKVINNRFEDCDRHGIYSISSDENNITNNTCQGNTRDGFIMEESDWNTVAGNICNGNSFVGIHIITCTDNAVVGNTCSGNNDNGIYLISSSINNTLVGNTCNGNTQRGIYLATASNNNTISGNTCNSSTNASGMRLSQAIGNTFVGNICSENAERGINIGSTSDNNTFSGNTCNGNAYEGLVVDSNNNMVSGNTCSLNGRHGIRVDDADDNTVVGNSCNGNDSLDTGTYSGINITDTSADNIIHSNTCNLNDKYGIDIDDANALRNWVKNNTLRGNTTLPMRDLGTGTKFASTSYQFTEAIVGAVVTASPTGVDVDLDTEQALAWGQIPREVQQVMRLKIWGVATAGPINVGGQMHLEITFNAGASNAAYNEGGKSWNIATFDGEETDYVANDIVHWEIVDADVGSELSAIVAGDSFEIFAIHEAGADPDGATDCLFRVVEVDYV